MERFAKQAKCVIYSFVLKIDVEGADFDTLTVFLETHKLLSPFSSTTLPIGQLQIELHAWDDYGKFDFFRDWWATLKAASTRPFWTELSLVYVNYNGGKPRLAEPEVRTLSSLWENVTDPPIAVLVYEYPRESFARLRGSRQSRRVLVEVGWPLALMLTTGWPYIYIYG
ncbi:hypothetical protein EDB84DRAFT_1504368 [Lactarius hengduanensis]|nr:hypothetical protein EDB84DRAFT_1504368 [Lactarius hengduanensis]